MKTNHYEGKLVMCVNKIKVQEGDDKQGTVILIGAERIYVLDGEGYIHACQGHEVYEIQVDNGDKGKAE